MMLGMRLCRNSRRLFLTSVVSTLALLLSAGSGCSSNSPARSPDGGRGAGPDATTTAQGDLSADSNGDRQTATDDLRLADAQDMSATPPDLVTAGPDGIVVVPDGSLADDGRRTDASPDTVDVPSDDLASGPDGAQDGPNKADALDARDGSSVESRSVEVGAGGRPPGYWMVGDWGVTGQSWAGCVWTQTDSLEETTTTIAPLDFTATHAPDVSYRVTGTVHGNLDAFAAIGFNLNEAVNGDANQCAYKTFDTNATPTPAVSFPTQFNLVAVNWTGPKPTYFGIELLGANGWQDANDRWCAMVSDYDGPTAAMFKFFHKGCWAERTGGVSGYVYAGEPVSAVMFVVPGDTKPQSFDFTIRGFALSATHGE